MSRKTMYMPQLKKYITAKNASHHLSLQWVICNLFAGGGSASMLMKTQYLWSTIKRGVSTLIVYCYRTGRQCGPASGVRLPELESLLWPRQRGSLGRKPNRSEQSWQGREWQTPESPVWTLALNSSWSQRTAQGILVMEEPFMVLFPSWLRQLAVSDMCSERLN